MSMTARDEKYSKLIQAGDMKARKKFIEMNRPLAKSFAARNRREAVEDDDVFQAAVMGIIEAADSYDHTKGAFSTYAYAWMQHYVTSEHARYSSSFSVGKARFIDRQRQKKGEEVKDPETLRNAFVPTVSLSAPVSSDGGMTVDEAIGERPEERDFFISNDANALVARALRFLDKRQESVVRGLHGIGTQEMNPAQLAEIHNCSKARIIQIHKKARICLREGPFRVKLRNLYDGDVVSG